MTLNKLNPRGSLNKAFLKVKPQKQQINDFKNNLSELINFMDEQESEEFHKNLLTQFLNHTYYDGKYFINTKDRSDLVIHNGKNTNTSVGVILEVKKPLNKSEMISLGRMNVKAFQELLLYYLRERISNNNLEIRNIIATNLHEWFIFDANVFEKAFANDKKLVNQFLEFEEGRLSGKTTDFFYEKIAQPAIQKLLEDGLTFTHFNLLDYKKLINSPKDNSKIVSLFKLLSPENLLKLPFVNDSNTLNKKFYSELLYIIGLSERKKGSQKIITRMPESKRDQGSLIESTITQLENLDKMSRIESPQRFGKNKEERLFNVSLELVITWINRILFLKLLEGQLMNYQKNDNSFLFLNSKKVEDFDELNNLFFSVLAKKHNERNTEVNNKFPNVPYLNSSLFEPTELEQSCFPISQLRKQKLHLYSSTVLKDYKGEKLSGDYDTLEYLFEFLNAYDFSSEAKGEVQDENKSLINASVLGLIFEKINGYKEGSFFTPGYITMLMCRDIIQKKIIQKFNKIKGWKCKDFDDLYNLIEDKHEANRIINDIKICDPAVGSGHFLVSALNEILAIKSELKILLDQEGRTLRDYHLEVVNDDLIITDEDGKFVEYNPGNKESQRIQETLFKEKKTIIENCLFGVDINPNSVHICRLRLWIELLKNAYYRTDSNFLLLETLPNIDINIKCGNSLISRYSLADNIGNITRKSKYTVAKYVEAVNIYRNAQNKQEKREMEQLISNIKNNFKSQIDFNDQDKLNELNRELDFETNQLGLFAKTKTENQVRRGKIKALKEKVRRQEKKIEEVKNNKIYENAFEWRTEFPEILDSKGKFKGFDIIIGNPPYVRVQNMDSNMVDYFFSEYKTPVGKLDISILFFEKGLSLLEKDGYMAYISSSQWMQTDYGKNLRDILSKGYLSKLIDFNSLPVFKDADTYPAIFLIGGRSQKKISYKSITKKSDLGYEGIINAEEELIDTSKLSSDSWSFNQFDLKKHLEEEKIKFYNLGKEDYADVLTGTLTGMDKAFIVEDTEIVNEDLEAELLVPYAYRGEAVKRFEMVAPKSYLIYPFKPDSENNAILIPEEELKFKYPNIYNHLYNHKDSLMKRKDSRKFYALDDWYRYLRKGSYNHINPRKLIFKGVGEVAKVGILPEDTAFNGANCPGIVLKEYSKSEESLLLAILNSSLITYYLNSICPKKLGGYYRYNTKNIAKIPIVNVEEEEKQVIINLVQQIRNYKYEIDAAIKHFISKLKGELGIVNVNNKIQEFYSHSFEDLLKQLSKQNITLSQAEVDVWENYYLEYASKVYNLSKEIEGINNNLDIQIYSMYSINEKQVEYIQDILFQ